LNDYCIQRVFLYHKAFYDITNFNNPTSLLQNLKYNVYFYNLLFNTNIIHYNLFNYSFNNPKKVFNSDTSLIIDNDKIKSDIEKISNILKIYSTTLVSRGEVSTTINNFTQISNLINSDKDKYYLNQGDLNKAINTYNMYLSTYDNVLLNFKIFMVIVILLILSIIAIYMTSEKYIDLNCIFILLEKC
jgi:hypothetical protein